MRIVFTTYIQANQFSSPEAWLERIYGTAGVLTALAALGHEVISMEQISYEGVILQNGVQYHFKRYTQSQLRFPRQLHRYILGLKPDILFIHGLHNPLQIVQLQALRREKLKIVVQHHAEQPYTGLKKYLQLLADQYISAYLFASRPMGMDWVKRGNLASPQKIHEVMEVSSVFEPMDKTLAKAKSGATRGRIFLWVGRLNQNKDPLTVVRAFLRFAVGNTGAHLYMIYHTNELLPHLQALLNEYPEQKQAVTLVGRVPHAELLYWFNSADVIVSGSHYEGSGTGVCEAMSCGCMPLVTDIPSFRMITHEGHCGLLYPAGDENALFAALASITETELLKKQAASLAYFNSRLSFTAIARQIQELAGAL